MTQDQAQEQARLELTMALAEAARELKDQRERDNGQQH
jgi:hypothetical protein